MDEAEHLVPSHQVEKRANEAGAASFAIRMQYRGKERTTELPLTQDMIEQLAFEAAFRNVSMGELIGEIIVALLKRDLCKRCSSVKKPMKACRHCEEKNVWVRSAKMC